MVHTVTHPLIVDELTRLRGIDCPPHDFRARVRRIASLMVPTVTRDFSTSPSSYTSPLEDGIGAALSHPVTLAPVLRAGLGFLDGFLDLIPQASVAHIGLARNEQTLQPEPYYLKHPADLAHREVIILDPMLATGGSASHAVQVMKDAGASRLRFACLVAAPEGIRTLELAHPDVPIFTAAVDRCLNEKGYIVPGLGDAGDRIFDT